MNNIDFIIRDKISNILIECRHEKQLTQADLARVFDVKPTTVASWEQGKSMPSAAMLYRISKYYGKSINYMYGDEING